MPGDYDRVLQAARQRLLDDFFRYAQNQIAADGPIDAELRGESHREHPLTDLGQDLLTIRRVIDATAVDALLRLLDSPSGQIRILATDTLAHIGPAAAAAGPRLVELFQNGQPRTARMDGIADQYSGLDRDGQIQQLCAVARALAAIRPPEIDQLAEALRTLIGDPPPAGPLILMLPLLGQADRDDVFSDILGTVRRDNTLFPLTDAIRAVEREQRRRPESIHALVTLMEGLDELPPDVAFDVSITLRSFLQGATLVERQDIFNGFHAGMKSSESMVRLRIAGVLDGMDDPEATQLLRENLEDPDAKVWERCALALVERRDGPSITRVMGRLKNRPAGMQIHTEALVSSIGTLHGSEHEDLLVDLCRHYETRLASGDEQTVHDAVRVLGNIAHPSTAPALAQIALSEQVNPSISATATLALRDLDGPEVVAIIRSTHDELVTREDARAATLSSERLSSRLRHRANGRPARRVHLTDGMSPDDDLLRRCLLEHSLRVPNFPGPEQALKARHARRELDEIVGLAIAVLSGEQQGDSHNAAAVVTSIADPAFLPSLNRAVRNPHLDLSTRILAFETQATVALETGLSRPHEVGKELELRVDRGTSDPDLEL